MIMFCFVGNGKRKIIVKYRKVFLMDLESIKKLLEFYELFVFDCKEYIGNFIVVFNE